MVLVRECINFKGSEGFANSLLYFLLFVSTIQVHVSRQNTMLLYEF